MKLTSFCTINLPANISFMSSHSKDPGNLIFTTLFVTLHIRHYVRYSHLKFHHLILNESYPVNKW